MSHNCTRCELLDYCECPGYDECSGIDCALDDWADVANSYGWSWWAFYKRLEVKYSHPRFNRLHEISCRESPFLARIRREQAPVETIATALVRWP